jgi:hypothetical protein
MRFLFRLSSLVFLAAATIAGTIDSIRSVVASAAVMTSLADAWKSFSADGFERMQASLLAEGRFAAAPLEWLLAQPAFAVFLALALLFWLVGYQRPVASTRFAG